MSYYKLRHFGIPGMRWGRKGSNHKTNSRNVIKKSNYPKNQNETKRDNSKSNKKKVAAGMAVVVGLLSSNVGSALVFNATGNEGAAKVAGVTLGIIGGRKYYDYATNK